MIAPERRRNLIIGMAGSGKTTLVEHMQARGYFALDGDKVEGLGVWRNADGEQATYQPTRAWRDSHTFRWDRRRLQDVLFYGWPIDEDGPLYLFGTAPNITDHAFWFQNVLALYADAATIYGRLRDPARQTPYPFETNQSDFPSLERAVGEYCFFNNRCLGYTAIDASRPVADVADEIVRQCEIPHSSPQEQPPLLVAEILSR